MPVRSIQGIQVGRDQGAQASGSMVLRYEADGLQSIAVVPLALEDGTAMQQVAYLSGDTADRRAELLAHLQANRAYYTEAIFETLDSASLIMLLSGISWHGKPLTDQVEPHPLAVAGNYLVLRAPAEDGDIAGIDDTTTWGSFSRSETSHSSSKTSAWSRSRPAGCSQKPSSGGLTRRRNSTSPGSGTGKTPRSRSSRRRSHLSAPTPGQPRRRLRRANSATRAQSPQPDCVAGSRRVTAALNALANGSMFRDMSGLAGTQAMAQAASGETLDAATKAGQIASDNFKAATTQATEMGKAAADMWKVMPTSNATPSGSQNKAGISGDGAKINQGKSLDQRGVSGSTSASPSGTSSSGTRVQGQQAVFAGYGSSEVTPPTFSRELAAFDQATAASPAYLGASTAALGNAASADLPAQISSALNSDNPGCSTSGSSDAPRTRRRRGLGRSGSPVDPNAIARQLCRTQIYGAWTNSSTRIYVNTQFFLDVIYYSDNRGPRERNQTALQLDGRRRVRY